MITTNTQQIGREENPIELLLFICPSSSRYVLKASWALTRRGVDFVEISSQNCCVAILCTITLFEKSDNGAVLVLVIGIQMCGYDGEQQVGAQIPSKDTCSTHVSLQTGMRQQHSLPANDLQAPTSRQNSSAIGTPWMLVESNSVVVCKQRHQLCTLLPTNLLQKINVELCLPDVRCNCISSTGPIAALFAIKP